MELIMSRPKSAKETKVLVVRLEQKTNVLA
ncbi:MAG: hypothetical protein UT41_C0003G0119 [Candidatus Wolfebacteria bacterium GW2011_GWC2_39_22]|uniref:Uncharacterized protein n=2 Tax=Candidatus Wolfeibacteriota TaxID=1752735 RepID=A0A0G1H6K1_9BACT|nr:MAG: hypothetical protein UT41_C0003G0119 [Candidatus Wolfebacteria bacterium GW2011_GWC2_39_22]KKT43021.1 MAG: hypothetical protein UW32_C0003G0124 [Candidatus Wolfebacteria bacterium GW2011_GWE2_44_13]